MQNKQNEVRFLQAKLNYFRHKRLENYDILKLFFIFNPNLPEEAHVFLLYGNFANNQAVDYF